MITCLRETRREGRFFSALSRRFPLRRYVTSRDVEMTVTLARLGAVPLNWFVHLLARATAKRDTVLIARLTQRSIEFTPHGIVDRRGLEIGLFLPVGRHRPNPLEAGRDRLLRLRAKPRGR